MKQVYLAFLGGSHGHFLEFILNGLDEKNDWLLFSDPFSIDGSARNNGVHAHNKFEIGDKRFVAGHYTTNASNPLHPVEDSDSRVLTITVTDTEESYFNWVKIRLIRAWIPECSPGPLDELHINTYDKLILEPLRKIDIYGEDFIKPTAVMFEKLLESINDSVGNTINPDNRSTDKWRIRSYFKNKYFSQTGKKKETSINPQSLGTEVIPFKFSYFYNKADFVNNIVGLAKEFNLTITEDRMARVKELHEEFLSKNQLLEYDGFGHCKRIFENLSSDEPIPHLSLIEESYVLSLIDDIIGKPTRYEHDEFFRTPLDVSKFIEVHK